MKRMSRFLKIAINFALGYILIPTGILAFLIMTNSSKGWGVYDQDGLWFVPVGVFLMLLCVSFVVVQIVSFVRFYY